MAWSDAPESTEPIGEGRDRYIRFAFPKINYAEGIATIWLKRGVGGVLSPANLFPITPESKAAVKRAAGKKNKVKDENLYSAAREGAPTQRGGDDDWE